MNKTLLKNFATAARIRLMDDVRYRLGLMGITDKGIASPIHQSSDMETYEYAKGQTYHLTGADVPARKALANMVRARGFEQVVEEVAYTWFNRLIAIRFMEVNDYLPHHTRVLSSATPGQKTPDIVTRALDIDLGLTDKEKQQVLDWKLSNKTDELFRFLFLKQCQQLSDLLPGLFDEGTEGSGYPLPTTPYSLLLTISYVNPAGIVAELLKIPESYFNVNEVDEDGEPTGQIQIIGWMYQYYNSELKDLTFAELKGSNKISKERIPAATQLFTPQWIVKYLVENSLGRLWVEKLIADGDTRTEEQIARSFGWRYYLPEANQPPEVAEQLKKQCKARDIHSPEDLSFLDPCMGSGHILVYAFDVLMQIYLSCGYTRRDAVKLIVQKNITGIDIDERAWQLSYFAVMMKARQYSQHALQDIASVDLFQMQETTGLSDKLLDFIASSGGAHLRDDLNTLKTAYAEAKTLGSIIRPPDINTQGIWEHYWREIKGHDYKDLEEIGLQNTAEKLFEPVILQHMALEKQYHAVVTNPPYMGSSGMDPLLASFVKEEYPDSKSDLFAVFIERCGEMTAVGGYTAMITQHAWMFLSSYEKLRQQINLRNIINMAHLGARAFDEISGEVVQTTAFVTGKSHTAGYLGTYARLIEPTSQDGKEEMFLAGENRYIANQDNFTKIPGAPVAYWASEALLKAFGVGKRMDNLVNPRQGLATADNDRFLRQWYEVNIYKVSFDSANADEAVRSEKKWFPYNKGGERRQWYGNYDFLVNWENDGYEIRNFTDDMGRLRSRPQNTGFYFREAITWGLITSGGFSIRYRTAGGIHDVSGMSAFTDDHETLLYLLALMSTHLADHVFKMVNPTINLQIGDFNVFPVLEDEGAKPKVNQIAEKSIELAKHDWYSFETSWDFRRHPMVGNQWLIARDQQLVPYDRSSLFFDHYSNWKAETLDRFAQLKANEEELNRIFIDIYGLQDELSPEVEDKDVTVYRIIDEPDEEERKMRYVLSKKDAVITLISYAVGCMFGRYSLDEEGLILAGQPLSDKFVYANQQYAGMAGQGGHTPASEIGECYIRLQDGTTKKCSFTPDDDNIIPITDEEYFSDDIVTRFVEWIRAAYGTETLEENLRFVADALGGSGTPRDVIRNYFLKDFYKDHKKTYKKRPIYWLFDSGRRNGFKALIYMHRYDQDTLGRVRVDYLHRLQGLYENAVGSCDSILASSASAAEKSRATKRREKLLRQLEECRTYDQALGHLAGQRIRIDLDDGVKHNHALFQGVELARDGRRAIKVDLLAKI
jgi:type II restriction/modification system DNA methylase subunit YeeA